MEELYRQNAKIVYRFLCARCGDAELAEDLTQETFLKAYQSLERYDGSCKVSVWLCQIAKHLLYQHWERSRRELPTEPDEEQPAHGTDTEHEVLTRIELVDVLKDMQRLPVQMREVMYLRIAGDLSFREIGEIMGHSENWARVNFFRGKEMLLKNRR